MQSLSKRHLIGMLRAHFPEVAFKVRRAITAPWIYIFYVAWKDGPTVVQMREKTRPFETVKNKIFLQHTHADGLPCIWENCPAYTPTNHAAISTAN